MSIDRYKVTISLDKGFANPYTKTEEVYASDGTKVIYIPISNTWAM
jgi:hypothetical protein